MAESVDVPKASRYKDTPVFRGTRGPEFGLWEPPPGAYAEDRAYRVHRIQQREVGFLDQIAVRYYGPGNEILWWFIAQSNGMLDPEKEMRVGQTIVIPPRNVAIQFRTRSTNLAE